MPQPRRYASNKDRQAAYRMRQDAARQKEQADRGLPPLPVIATLPGYPRWSAIFARCLTLLSVAHEEMTAYFDERSETWQEGDRGEVFSERIERLADICSSLEELCNP